MSYNGYTNYETWCVCLWMSNEQGTHEHWADNARSVLEDESDRMEARTTLAERMEEDAREMAPEIPASMFSDLFESALGAVDWREIAEVYLTYAEEA